MNWRQNKQIELKYRRSLQRINKKIMDAVRGLKTVKEIKSALHKVYKSIMFRNIANKIANRFVTNANTIDARTWREAARAGSKSKQIYKALQETLNTNIGHTVDQQILKNANLIKTLPLELSKEITKFVGTKTYEGIRPEEIAETLQGKIFQYTRARAGTIARTESSKAMTALTEARSKDIGVSWYVWLSAKDQRVRKAHKHMQGVLVNWNDPPSPEALVNERDVGKYSAGNIYNCRCFPRPLISFENVKWPCKVYHNGSITKMSELQFKKIM